MQMLGKSLALTRTNAEGAGRSQMLSTMHLHLGEASRQKWCQQRCRPGTLLRSISATADS